MSDLKISKYILVPIFIITIILTIFTFIVVINFYFKDYMPKEINNTKVIETIKECPSLNCPSVNIPKCPSLTCYKPECKTEIKTIIDPNCQSKLNLCNIRLDELNNNFYEYMTLNNSDYREELQINLTRCNQELNKTKEIIRGLI